MIAILYTARRTVASVALSALTAVAVLTVSLGVSLAAPAPAYAAPTAPPMEVAQRVAAEKLALTDATTPVDRYPFYTVGPDAWGLGGGTGWVFGFLPGSLWYHYELTGDAAARSSASARQATLAHHARTTHNHDIGFMFTTSYGNGYRLTGDPVMRETLLTAAASLATRYSPRVGMVRTTNTPADFWVYNDTLMNLELLFWGARSGGDPAWRAMAMSHALRTAADFIRDDGSTYHYVAYREDTGAAFDKGQGQGYAAESTWSRGQAWVIYGMAIAHRETGDPRFLDAARRTTAYWIANVPDDLVPYWDFDAPAIPDEPRDTSAAAIVASACLELARLEPDREWRQTYADLAATTLESLSSPAYLAEGNPLPAVLKHGTHAKMLGAYDHGTSWGDYYFREALLRSASPTERVGGPDRYHTSARTSYAAFPEAETVVIASGEDFADALAASALAGAYDAPLLLTRPGAVPAPVRAELVRLGARRVFLVGGPCAVSAEVEEELRQLVADPDEYGELVTRVAGADRYETAVLAAAWARPARLESLTVGAEEAAGVAVAETPPVPLAFVARGDDFADALAAAPVAYAHVAPVLLTTADALHPAAEETLRRLRPERIVVLGGEASLSAAVETRLGEVAAEFAVDTTATTATPPPAAPTVTRIGGSDRYDTAARFARWAHAEGLASPGHAGVVSGRTFPDALGAAASVGSRGGLLLSTRPDVLDRRTSAWLAEAAAGEAPLASVTVFGGESVISGRAAHEVRTIVR